jgi:hypothetical protein
LVEESIEELRDENSRLRDVLYKIDSDIDRAAGRYLNPTVAHGRLQFRDFLGLLVLEIKRSERQDLKGEAKQMMIEEIRRQIDERAESLIPLLEIEVAKCIAIPVLIRFKGRPEVPFRKAAGPAKYQVVPLRGNAKSGRGSTPEEAYLKFRDSLTLALLKASESRKTMVGFLLQENEGLGLEYGQAEPFRSDEIHGFKVEVRLGKPVET